MVVQQHFHSSSQEQFPLLLTYQPKYDISLVKRLLGSRNQQKLSNAIQNRLQVMQKHLDTLVRPRLTYTVQKIHRVEKGTVSLGQKTRLHSHKMAFALKKARKAVIFIATIGEKMDKELQNLMRSGSMADAYVADALGSGAVEHTANRFHLDFDKQLQASGLAAGLRFSPGYCDWPLTDQQKIFSLVHADPVGVSLDSTSLMTPRKSISALFGIYPCADAPNLDKYNPCRHCAKNDCIARRGGDFSLTH
jgi:hypothetical protein